MYRVLYVLYVRRGVTVRDNGIYRLKSSAINPPIFFSHLFTRFRELHSLLHSQNYTLCHYTPLSHYTPKRGCNRSVMYYTLQ